MVCLANLAVVGSIQTTFFAFVCLLVFVLFCFVFGGGCYGCFFSCFLFLFLFVCLGFFFFFFGGGERVLTLGLNANVQRDNRLD